MSSIKKSLEEIKANNKEWRKIAFAFYSVAHNDLREWQELPDDLKASEVGDICQKYIESKDIKYLEEAGQMIAGKNWFIALGRSF
ncbi:hypothetical protein Misp06_00749 [Microbulbifer sp. NBRC 101763]|uniref:hypothetical protein n=1 Tax=unclassified Microbulbifer TaxID=2619833 RepID=UPI0030B60F2B